MKSLSRNLLLLLTFVSVVSVCSAENGQPEPYHVVLFLAFGIGLGIFFVQALHYLGDPVHYTICLFISGILLSLAGNGGHGAFGDSVSIWLTIDAELLLHVFLPPLIFGEAMHLNWYQARRAMLQASTLAGPGVLVGAVLTGCFAKAIQPDWGWPLAMTFGAITSATDPVAVVALLKSAGASPKLTMIVVGESLLNDGTAMVLFAVFFEQLKGAEFNFGNALLYIIQACVGSCIVGAAVGYIAVRWLRAFKRPMNDTDVLMQIAITVCAAYMVFYITQSALGLSGVLGCCAAGIVFAWLAPPYILHHSAMKRIWGMMEWMLNTMIFLLAGLIIGAEAFRHVRASDWGCLVALYIVLMFVRALVIAGCYPIISQVGYKCTPQEAVFLVWGGLRGAVGLALAMMTHGDGPEGMDEQTSRLLFYVGGIASITLLLNATTTNALLVKLGLLGMPKEKKMVQASVLRKLQQRLCEDLEDLTMQFAFSEREVVEVCQNVSMLNSVNVKALMASTAVRGSGSKAQLLPAEDDVGLATDYAESQLDDGVVMSPFATPVGETAGGEGDHAELGPSMARASSSAGSGRFGIERLSPSKAPRGEAAGGRPSRREGEMMEDGYVAPNAAVDEPPRRPLNPLLQHIRYTFLSIIRVHYWHDIETGRLPRGSKSERFLLYTIEVALDEVEHETDGARDWVCAKEKLDWVSYKFTALCWLEHVLPEWSSGSLSQYLNELESKGEERAAYILTSFIAAHEHAQSKIHGYLCVESGQSTESDRTPEELQVIAESQWAVSCARRWLEAVNPEMIAAMRVRQATGLLLTKLSEGISAMLEEGLVTEQDAEAAMATLDRDTYRMQQKGHLAVERLGDWFKNRRRQPQAAEGAGGGEWSRL